MGPLAGHSSTATTVSGRYRDHPGRGEALVTPRVGVVTPRVGVVTGGGVDAFVGVATVSRPRFARLYASRTAAAPLSTVEVCAALAGSGSLGRGEDRGHGL